MVKKNFGEDKYYDTDWKPRGWKKKEWQIVWRKLWLLEIPELKKLARQLGTYFTDKNITPPKGEWIELIGGELDWSADKKAKALVKKYLEEILRKKGYCFAGRNYAEKIKELNELVKKQGAAS